MAFIRMAPGPRLTAAGVALILLGAVVPRCSSSCEQTKSLSFSHGRTKPCPTPRGSRCCVQWQTPGAEAGPDAYPPLTFFDKMSFASGYDIRYAVLQLNRAKQAGFLPNVIYTWQAADATAAIDKLWRGLREQCVTNSPLYDRTADGYGAYWEAQVKLGYKKLEYENHGSHCMF